MRKPKFSDEKMVSILRETDKEPVAAVAKRHSVTPSAIYAWKKRFGTFQTEDVKRLRKLEIENSRLKKILAERDLEIEVMKEINAKKW
jgi:putative transposase